MELTIQFEENIVDILAELVKDGELENLNDRLQKLASALAEATIDAYLENMYAEIEEGVEPSIGISGSMKLSDMLSTNKPNQLH